jgi:hypothetical protein
MMEVEMAGGMIRVGGVLLLVDGVLATWNPVAGAKLVGAGSESNEERLIGELVLDTSIDDVRSRVGARDTGCGTDADTELALDGVTEDDNGTNDDASGPLGLPIGVGTSLVGRGSIKCANE